MTWDWYSFLAGAPLWGSVGIVLFATLLGGGRRMRRSSEPLYARIARHRRDLEDPDVVSLSNYRLEKSRSLVLYGEGRRAPLDARPAAGLRRPGSAGTPRRPPRPSTEGSAKRPATAGRLARVDSNHHRRFQRPVSCH